MTVYCLHCDLWNVPSKRIVRLCEFLLGFQSCGTMFGIYSLEYIQQFIVGYDTGMGNAAWSVMLDLCCRVSPFMRL